MFTFLRQQGRRLLAVRQPEAAVIELVVTTTRAAEASLRTWAERLELEVLPMPMLADSERGTETVRLREVRALQGRLLKAACQATVSCWIEFLQHRAGIAIVSFSYRPVETSTWQNVHVKEDNSLLEVVLVPAGQAEEKTLEDVAARQGKDASQLRPSINRSWALRSQENRFLWIIVPVFFVLIPVSVVEVVVPGSRSLVLLVVCLLFVVSGLVYLIKDQSVRALSTQFAVLGAALAAICYEATRYAYENYYERLGITTEQAGLDYRSIMSNQPFFVLSVVLILMTIVLSVYSFVKTFWRWPTVPRAWKALFLVVLGGYVVLLTPLISARELWRDANRAAETVRAGGSPSVTGNFVWPDPARVALAAPPSSPSGVQQSAYSTTLANGDLRLLGGDASSWFVLDSVTGSTFPLPRASSPLLIAESGVTRIVTLTRDGVRPGRVVVPPGKPQKVALYDETGVACAMTSGPYEVQEHGQTSIVNVTVRPSAEVDVQVACRTANTAGAVLPRTLALVAGRQ